MDLGYRGVDADNPGIEIIHRVRYKAMIGHAKSDNRMDRCWLQGALGDALHALSCAAGYNIPGFFAWLTTILPYAVLPHGLG